MPQKIEDTIGDLVPINAHASDPLTKGETDGVLIEAAGDLVCLMAGSDGVERTLTLPAGYFPFRITHVRATSTATGKAAYR